MKIARPDPIWLVLISMKIARPDPKWLGAKNLLFGLPEEFFDLLDVFVQSFHQ